MKTCQCTLIEALVFLERDSAHVGDVELVDILSVNSFLFCHSFLLSQCNTGQKKIFEVLFV